ncbi:phosphoglucosamine mutase [Curtanaerobium respiraculi]|uniref:phosphoglucosamine mutase n=1 Tax=Curtanaerobium respiraculi TaxID=2949669 RepID=UPI0024B32E28|nr:phosphoglucosamine mutase [Curtanaerobium respiraculi]
MGKYFGTDGFRGEAGKILTADHAYKIGRILGWLALQDENEKQQRALGRPRIIIGKDTRRSGYMLESALAAGIAASGVDAYMMYVTTTPSVAYITRTEDFCFGVMISASHNPYYDNGIKVLSATGEKLDEGTIARIEEFIDGAPDSVPYATGDAIGVTRDYSACRERYAGYLIQCPAVRSFDRRIALDCANGGSYMLAKHVFEALGAEAHAIHYAPNGLNINVDCGSTHIESLQEYVRNNGLDVGFAFDGDADRCLAVDENGNVVNGDQIMYVAGVWLKGKGQLANNTVVTTIMSNFGLYKALDAAGIGYEKTKVGDKYVWENMRANGHVLGGEQSGHIIFGDYARTGDGILTALMVMQVMLETGEPLSELAAPCRMYPQVLKNVHVDSKEGAMDDPAVAAAVAAAGEALGDTGRVLVRPSGTEPVVRVMAEAPDAAVCEKHVDDIIAAMEASGHIAG